jgi:hypothetical protein
MTHNSEQPLSHNTTTSYNSSNISQVKNKLNHLNAILSIQKLELEDQLSSETEYVSTLKNHLTSLTSLS